MSHSLRAGLDIRKANIKVLFAGSSEAALREMFSRAAAPFYNWAPLEPFPLLGREFVDATVRHLASVAKTRSSWTRHTRPLPRCARRPSSSAGTSSVT